MSLYDVLILILGYGRLFVDIAKLIKDWSKKDQKK